MANIHAINAQGTEYGITAENGITQEQVDAIATIGDAADLETTEKTTLVGAVNEVNGKFQRETVLYENPNPTAGQDAQTINVSGLANAKALKITFGTWTTISADLIEEVRPLAISVENNLHLAQVFFNADDSIQSIRSRTLSLNSARSRITIGSGTYYTKDMDEGTEGINYSAGVAKVIKIVALF